MSLHPSKHPHRRRRAAPPPKRLGKRLAYVVAAVAGLAAAYWWVQATPSAPPRTPRDAVVEDVLGELEALEPILDQPLPDLDLDDIVPTSAPMDDSFNARRPEGE